MEPDWPEHLKTVATMGGHVVGLGSPDQRRAACTLNLQLLQELRQLTHKDQKSAIELMIASAEFSFALVEIEREDFEAALEHTRRQLSMLEKISKVNGEHILISPLETTANILSQLLKYKEAAGMYERALQIVEKLYGTEQNAGLSTLLMNCGISYFMHSQNILNSPTTPDKQVQTAKRAKKLMLKGKEMLVKGKKLLVNYESIHSGHNLNHLNVYMQKVVDGLSNVDAFLQKQEVRYIGSEEL